MKGIFKISKNLTLKKRFTKTASNQQNYHKQSSKDFLTKTKILKKVKSNKETQILLIKSLNQLVEELVSNNQKTDCIRLYIGYSNDNVPSLKLTLNFSQATNNYSEIIKTVIRNYNLNASKTDFTYKIGISFNKVVN